MYACKALVANMLGMKYRPEVQNLTSFSLLLFLYFLLTSSSSRLLITGEKSRVLNN